MPPKYTYKSKNVDIRVYEKSFMIKGCHKAAFLGTDVRVQKLPKDFIPILGEMFDTVYNAGYEKGRKCNNPEPDKKGLIGLIKKIIGV